jgi:hypothetical protein
MLSRRAPYFVAGIFQSVLKKEPPHAGRHPPALNLFGRRENRGLGERLGAAMRAVN